MSEQKQIIKEICNPSSISALIRIVNNCNIEKRKFKDLIKDINNDKINCKDEDVSYNMAKHLASIIYNNKNDNIFEKICENFCSEYGIYIDKIKEYYDKMQNEKDLKKEETQYYKYVPVYDALKIRNI